MLASLTLVNSIDLHKSEEHGFVWTSFPLQLFLDEPVPGIHCRFLVFRQSSLQSDHSDQADHLGGSTCGQVTQSLLFFTLDPWQGWPPLLGGGLLQVLVLILPAPSMSPGHLQSVHCDQADQPPLTKTINCDVGAIRFAAIFSATQV